jgi:predicted RNase H-like HicB family nuclease
MRDRIYGYLVEVIVEPDDDQFYAYCPGLAGVHEAGQTAEEALANAYDAILSIVEARHARGETLPEGPHLAALHRPPALPLKGIGLKVTHRDQARGQRKEVLVTISG